MIRVSGLSICAMIVNDSLVRRIKALGAIPTPFASYVYYHGEKMREYGSERLNHMFALRVFWMQASAWRRDRIIRPDLSNR